ncbi:MAG: hypothetical protein WCI52_00860 [bacterium]
MKEYLKNKAISLRKEGKVYSEILREVPVAKSTLSLWLRDVGLAKKQFQRITKKKLLASKRGGEAKHRQRIEKQTLIINQASNEVGVLSKRELWLIGVALYWAEGSKEKEHRPGSNVQFSNSDWKMILLFLNWLKAFCNVKKEEIGYEIYIHKTYENRIDKIKEYWLEMLGETGIQFKVCYKKHNIKTNRKNSGNMYNGVLRITVRKSSTLLRKITGWTEGFCRN